MGSRLVKMVDLVVAIFCGHSRDGMGPRMEGWVEIDYVVAYLSLKIQSHSCGCSFRGAEGLVDEKRADEDGKLG